MTYQRILVPLDRSLYSKTIFEQALEIAKKDGASLMLLHCLSYEPSGLPSYSNLYGEDLMNFSQAIGEHLKEETEEVRQWLTDYSEIAKQQGVNAEWEWKIGQAPQWICDLAQTWQPDLIILGRRGLRGVAEFILGSVSNYIVHHVQCSVLVLQGSLLPETNN